jgi:hypothetical protein
MPVYQVHVVNPLRPETREYFVREAEALARVNTLGNQFRRACITYDPESHTFTVTTAEPSNRPTKGNPKS